jgi:hypothetical protein
VNDAVSVIVGLLAQGPPRDTGPDFGKAAPFGLLIVVLLLLGTFGLIWSMNRHLRKLPESFETDDREPAESADDDTVGVEPDAPVDGTNREPDG